jgi:hypothetical protein
LRKSSTRLFEKKQYVLHLFPSGIAIRALLGFHSPFRGENGNTCIIYAARLFPRLFPLFGSETPSSNLLILISLQRSQTVSKKKCFSSWKHRRNLSNARNTPETVFETVTRGSETTSRECATREHSPWPRPPLTVIRSGANGLHQPAPQTGRIAATVFHHASSWSQMESGQTHSSFPAPLP